MRAFLIIAALCACKDSATKPPPPSPPASTLAPTAAVPATPVDPSAPPTDLVKGANQFGLALWRHLRAGNLAVSPASIAIPLTIAWGGAKGTTATQLGNLLHLSGAPDVVLSRWGNLAKSLTDPSRPFTLRLADRLYGEKTSGIDTTYFTIVRHAFDVWIEPVDFINTADDVLLKINAWVEEQTQQRIRGLVPPKSFSPATKLAIVNAITFLGDWALPFDRSLTQPHAFWVDGTTEAQVPTMWRRDRFRYATGNGAALIELPYWGGELSMYVLVPDARDGLATIEKSLESMIKGLQSKLAEHDVELSLPRFYIDDVDPLQLDQPLQALGVTDALSAQTADFSNMATSSNKRDKLFLSSVIHRSFIKAEEGGQHKPVAAPAVPAPGAAKPTELHVDHPFLFVVVDKTTGLILFLGRVVDPSS